MLPILATVKAVPGKEAELEAVLKGFVPITRKEKGCVQYDLHKDAHEAGTFYFIELWESEKDLQAHLAAPHIAAGAAHKGKLFSSLDIRTLSQIA